MTLAVDLDRFGLALTRRCGLESFIPWLTGNSRGDYEIPLLHRRQWLIRGLKSDAPLTVLEAIINEDPRVITSDALKKACAYGDLQVVEMFHRIMNQRESRWKNTHLKLALESENLDLLDWFLQLDPSPFDLNHRGRSKLLVVGGLNNSLPQIDRLVMAGARCTEKDILEIAKGASNVVVHLLNFFPQFLSFADCKLLVSDRPMVVNCPLYHQWKWEQDLDAVEKVRSCYEEYLATLKPAIRKQHVSFFVVYLDKINFSPENGNTMIIKYLLDRYPDGKYQRYHGCSSWPITIAANYRAASMRYIVEKFDYSLQPPNFSGYTVDYFTITANNENPHFRLGLYRYFLEMGLEPLIPADNLVPDPYAIDKYPSQNYISPVLFFILKKKEIDCETDLRFFFDLNPELFYLMNKDGEYPLNVAARLDKINLFPILWELTPNLREYKIRKEGRKIDLCAYAGPKVRDWIASNS